MSSPGGAKAKAAAARWVAGAALALTLAHLAYVQVVWEGSFAREVLEQAARRPGEPGAWEVGTDPTERQLSDAAGDGNVFVRFVGFDSDVPWQEAFVMRTYFWGTYALYPRRVFAGDPGRAVNDGRPLTASAFEPDERWLAEHGVRSVVRYQIGAGGRVRATAWTAR